MKKLAAFLAFLILMAGLNTIPAYAAPSGYWVLSETRLDYSDPYDSGYWVNKVSASSGSAIFTSRGAQNEYTKASTNWTSPPKRVEAGASIEIKLASKVDALTNRDDCHTVVTAFFDVPDLGMGTVTAGTSRLTDGWGTYACETWKESTALTVSGSLGTGSASGEKKALYVESYNNGMLAQNQYIYAWIVKSEGGGDSGTRFSSLSGTVEVASDEDFQLGNWHYAQLNEVLPVNAHIRTGEESSCILSFADMSTFVMLEETHIILNAPPDKDDKIALVWGKIKANVKKMMKDGSMEIDMSQAVAGIKGTTFVCEDNGTTSTLKVFEGKVEFTSKATGEAVMVGAGQQVSADGAGLSPVTKLDEKAENAVWAFADDATSDATSDIRMILLIVLIALGIAAVVIVVLMVVRHRKSLPRNATVPPSTPAAPQQAAQTFCAQCGAKLAPGDMFCKQCGKNALQ